MRNEILIYFKNLLTRQLEELEMQADNQVVDWINRDERATDLIDIAAIESERAYTLRIREREHRLIHKIRQSLEDIQKGTYGICKLCGEDISVSRLKARPVARHCIECKQKMERLERASGF
ncbi:MAG: hypothetical protein AMJ54_00405 [Deltaproteobacteria bacterium SG8_13]|nr:MAG: hypothetical protein AMJ54_00405 [Deltaproteobacteria bacterium SG8_13]